MNKKLDTTAITNELKGGSLFFQRPAEPDQETSISTATISTDQRDISKQQKEPNGKTERVTEGKKDHPNGQPFGRPNGAPERLPERQAERVSRTGKPNGSVEAEEYGYEEEEKTERFSFETYPSLKRRLAEYLRQYKKKRGRNLSKSRIIRDAIGLHLDTLFAKLEKPNGIPEREDER
jgi:hypothetical protein